MSFSSSEILNFVRIELLKEARNSPGLLTDLANLERYVAETYSSRSFIELLQNADDANASHFEILRHGDWLVCANNGNEFSQDDFYSLCRSASSSKQRGTTIGYRGIGFKSIVGMASSVHLISGDLQATFSRELTQESLETDALVPLIRIPHPFSLHDNQTIVEIIEQLKSSGLTTVFILGGLNLDNVKEEFVQFDSDYLLFLRNVKKVTLTDEVTNTYQCQRKDLDEQNRKVVISTLNRDSAWHISRFSKCDIAYSLADGLAVPLNPSFALVHAFLPTQETTGFGVRINADFSTDPSRTRIIFDETTEECIEHSAKAIANIIKYNILSSSGDQNVLSCLMPTMDLSTISLQKKSFRTELISRVKKKIEHLNQLLILSPSWIEFDDVNKMIGLVDKKIIIPLANNEKLVNFMRYLGVKTLSLEEILSVAEKLSINQKSLAELVVQSIRSITGNVSFKQLVNKQIWVSNHSSKSMRLSSLVERNLPLSQDLVNAIYQSGVTKNEFYRILINAGLKPEDVLILLPETECDVVKLIPNKDTNKSVSNDNEAFLDTLFINPSLKKEFKEEKVLINQYLPAWRGAEQYVGMLLESYGYEVEDCSRQNLGYDILVKKNGQSFYIETKLIDYPGQPFIITSNEEAVAREYKDAYVIALVLRGKKNEAYVQFISNPTRSLKFVRQCRQWVWECSDYKFDQSVKGSYQ